MPDTDSHRLAERGIRIGITGWTEPTLIKAGSFYPADVAEDAEERLRFYAQQFPLVEVDSTYYAPPSERVAGLWVERTPADFVFDIKAFRLLTRHPTPPSSMWKDLRSQLPAEQAEKRNVYVDDLAEGLRAEAFDRFAAALMPLHSAGKLGLVLFQFPQWFLPGKKSRDYLAWAAERLAEYQVSVEFRNGLWMDEDHRERTLRFLSDHRLTYVCVDEPQGFSSSVPPVSAVTAGVAAVRFHGRNSETWEAKGISAAERFAYDYSKEELEEWVPKIEALHEQARPVHVLMNNCYSDYAVRSGRQLAGLLTSLPLE
ncbi:MAG: DUF72 domain-containing protein [Actinomycetota bacterium]|nr:DUF72 domain-containing protein [Actinomycetota bacterium]